MGLAAEVQEPDATAKDDGGRRRASGTRDLAQEDGRGARSGDGEAWARKAGRGVEAEATGGAGAEQQPRRDLRLDEEQQQRAAPGEGVEEGAPVRFPFVLVAGRHRVEEQGEERWPRQGQGGAWHRRT